MAAMGLVVVLAAGCSTGSSSGSTGGGGSEAKQGGTLTYLALEDVSSMDPVTMPGTTVTTSGLRAAPIFDSLLNENSTTGAVEPGLLTSWTSTDQATWTLKVRPNVRFSDGTPFDAAAIKFNWDRLADPANHSPALAIMKTISSATVTDPSTLTVTLANPNSAFPVLIAEWSLNYIGSPTAIQKEGTGFGTAPVGAGPFTMTSWVMNAQMALAKNPNYWNAPLPHLNSVVIKVIPDETQRYNSLLTGAGQAEFTLAPQTVTQAQSAGMKAQNNTLQGGYDLVFNQKQAPFDDIRARQAFALSVDVNKMSSIINNPAATTLFTQTSPFYAAVATPSPDHAKAQALFDQIAAEQGHPVTFTINGSPAVQNHVDFLISQFTGYNNVKVTSQIVATTARIPQVIAGNFQVTIQGTQFINPLTGLKNVMTTGGTVNYGKYSNPAVDAAFAAASRTDDAKAQTEDMLKIQQAYVTDLPYLLTLRQVYSTVYSTKVEGVSTILDCVPRFDLMSLNS
jgi:peptide/nickel transport system substrate-binding protein